MARSNRIWPNLYFGRPGAYVTLPYPRGGMARPYDRQTFDFVTGTGQHLTSSSSQGSRPYTMNWRSMHGDSFTAIDQFWSGSVGVGPWALIDPSVPNLLLPNQASATNVLYDTTNLATSTGAASMGTILSNTDATNIHRAGATRSIRWQWSIAASGSPTMVFGPPYRNWFGIPVVVGLPYSWSFWAKPDGVVDSSITTSARIQWLDKDGNQLSESTGGDFTPSTWLRFSVTATAPANACYARPVIVCASASITTGASLYVDEPLLEQDSAVNPWAPGMGLRPVEILSLVEALTFDARWRQDITMTLRELAA
jgi:hypothetical protein